MALPKKGDWVIVGYDAGYWFGEVLQYYPRGDALMKLKAPARLLVMRSATERTDQGASQPAFTVMAIGTDGPVPFVLDQAIPGMTPFVDDVEVKVLRQNAQIYTVMPPALAAQLKTQIESMLSP